MGWALCQPFGHDGRVMLGGQQIIYRDAENR